MDTAALDGLLVAEIGARIGASVAGSLLAQLGATVVYVEARESAGAHKSRYRAQYAAGKRSLVFDPAKDAALLARLVERADVVLASSDVDPPLAGAPSAHAVVCDVTAFGSSGPLAGRPASDREIQALSGILECTGMAGGPALAIPIPLVEQLAGVYAASAVLAALRLPTGADRRAEIALYDVAFSAMTSFLAPALAGAPAQATRVGNRHTMAAPWNVYRAPDGWVLACAGSDDQWARLCARIGVEPVPFAKNAERVAHVGEVDAIVTRWLAGRDIASAVRELTALGIPCGPVAPIDGAPREANLDHRGMILEARDPESNATIRVPGSPFRLSRTPGRPLTTIPAGDADRSAIVALLDARRPRPAAVKRTASRPHAGVRVLEIGHYTTAPVAARLLAALGADVIKVEPPGGEAVRGWPPTRNGQGVFFTFQNVDKRSLVLDVETAEGRATLERLIVRSDVLIENLRPGALARKGFGPERLALLNPRLVTCAISGFGLDSIYPGRAAFDAVIQAMCGLMDLVRIDGMPLKTGPSLADVIGAAFALVAVLAALHERDRSGAGQFIDLSMQDIGAWASQAAWNRPPAPIDAETADVPGIAEVLAAPQTRERGLWHAVTEAGVEEYVIASPVRLAAMPAPIPRPGPRLGRDTPSILGELACPTPR